MSNLKNFISENGRLLLHKVPFLYHASLIYLQKYGKIYYKRLCKSTDFNKKLQGLKNSHEGERCFVIGNGPSLAVTDLEKLTEEDCFGASRIYKIFDRTVWRPKYYTVVDWRGLDNEEINSLEVENLFLGDYYYRKHNVQRNDIYVFYGYRIINPTEIGELSVSEDISEKIILAATVTFASIQIAMYMGYKEIYLIGMDHNYAYVRDADGNVVRNPNAKESHFFADKDPSKNYADMVGMENAYITVKEYADEHGIKILNATRGGALEIFDRVDFDSIRF
ncbi:MAG: DUF115 domain-containing protein [Clostridiaceae bacterium]|nr:DUF115 domain-containing protein [Clostridiaceae bacterium]